MKRRRIVLLVAMVIFVGSFFGAGAMGTSKFITSSEFPGWFCAEETLLLPWSHDPSLHQNLLGNIALLLSGLINPIFLVTVVLLFRERARKLVNVLRIALLLMFPACWVVFSEVHLLPRYSYFIWTAAMLLALFSSSFSNQVGNTETQRAIF